MDRLLAPGGCPWDREQTLDSLRPYLIEETYEVIDALTRGDVAGHCEELGDVLLQVVFHSALRRAEGAFDIDDVATAVCEKLISRHPHVFGNTQAMINTSDQVLAQWDDLKAKEKAAKGTTPKRTLDGIPPGPALVRAQKIGSRCGKVGFDWPGWQGSLAKVREEASEVQAAIQAGDPAQVRDEMGDLLLACVNLARKVGVDAENALIDASRRFEQRFAVVEDLLAQSGKAPAQSTLEEMDALWNQAKQALARK